MILTKDQFDTALATATSHSYSDDKKRQHLGAHTMLTDLIEYNPTPVLDKLRYIDFVSKAVTKYARDTLVLSRELATPEQTRIQGHLYNHGIGGTQRNLKTAYRCYQLAAEKKDAVAQYTMGSYLMYLFRNQIHAVCNQMFPEKTDKEALSKAINQTLGVTDGTWLKGDFEPHNMENIKASLVTAIEQSTQLPGGDPLQKLAAFKGSLEKDFPHLFTNIPFWDITTTKKSEAEMYLWFQAAAQQGHPAALNNLGYIYNNALGVTQDHTVAVMYFKHAAEKGYPIAQDNLAASYYDGRGTDRHLFLAVKWAEKAFQNGRGEKYSIWKEELHQERATVTERIASSFAYTGYQGGNPEAALRVICATYQETYYIDPKRFTGENVTHFAAALHSISNHPVFLTYPKHPEIVAKLAAALKTDPKTALTMYQEPAKHGDALAQNNLAHCYYSGRGIDRDLMLAVSWGEKAVANGQANEQLDGWKKELQEERQTITGTIREHYRGNVCEDVLTRICMGLQEEHYLNPKHFTGQKLTQFMRVFSRVLEKNPAIDSAAGDRHLIKSIVQALHARQHLHRVLTSNMNAAIWSAEQLSNPANIAKPQSEQWTAAMREKRSTNMRAL